MSTCMAQFNSMQTATCSLRSTKTIKKEMVVVCVCVCVCGGGGGGCQERDAVGTVGKEP